MQNKAIRKAIRPAVNQKRGSSAYKRKSVVRNMSFLATAVIALLASSYLLQNQFLPAAENFLVDAVETDYVAPDPVVEISQPLPSLVPTISMRALQPLGVNIRKELRTTSPSPALRVPSPRSRGEGENEGSSLGEDVVLTSQLPDINSAFASRPSQIPGWLVAAVRQQVQPSPRRVLDVAIEEEHDDSLVVRDRVVVIPKVLHPQQSVPTVTVASTSNAPVPHSAPGKITVSQNTPHKIGQAKAFTKQFTIQILASRKREQIMRFVNSHKIGAEVNIRLTKRDGLDWYVLTIGQFAQVEQARAAIKNLPTELARLNPWVRPAGQLKALA